MAKTTATDLLWLGDKRNKKQTKLAIPAGPAANQPGALFLEAIDGSGVLQDGLYLWASNDDKLHISTSYPTDEDADGTAIDTTAIGGASTKALDNLSGVAINTSLVSDTDSTDDLGSSSIYWANAYLDKIYLNSTATISGASAGVSTFDGGITIGTDGDGHDLILYGETATQYAQWDMNYNSNAGGFILKDNVELVLGTGNDISLNFDTADLAIDVAADNTIVAFGKASDVDVRFASHDNANYDAGWISDIYTLQLCDNTILQIGGAAFDTVTTGFKFSFASAVLSIDGVTADDSIAIGATTDTDMVIHGGTASYDITWDASANTWTYLDSTIMSFGTSDDITFSYDGVNNELDILGSGKAVLFGVNDTGIDVKFFGATDGDYMLWDETNDQLLFEDAKIAIAGANVTYTQAISTDELLFDGTDHANCGITFGTSGTNGMDVLFQSITAGDTIAFDAGGKTLTFADVNLVMGEEYIQFYDSAVKILSSADGQLDIDADGEVEIASAALDINVTASTISGTLAVAGAQTNAAGIQSAAVAVIATATGATTGTIVDGTTHATVTVATDADDIVILPTPTPGNVVWLHSGSVAYEIRSSAPNTVLINGGTGGAAVESAVLNTDIVTRCVCTDATHWILTHFAADGTESKADAAT